MIFQDIRIEQHLKLHDATGHIVMIIEKLFSEALGSE
jgi:hypothetical protein